MKKTLILLISSFLFLLLFALLNLSLSWFADKYQLDVSYEKKYTISQTSADIAQSLQNEVVLKFYLSDNLDVEQKNYADYIFNILKQYQKSNPQKIKLELRSIVPYSASEKAAIKLGLVAMPIDDQNSYLGLNISATDFSQTIPYFSLLQQDGLQNDINRILWQIENKNKPVVGISAPNLPVFKSQKGKIWSIIPLLQQNYSLIEIPESRSYIPFGVDVLIVINPSNISSIFSYAIDQYLMRGGKLIIFLDPYSEILQHYQGYPAKSKTNLTGLLAKNGVIYDNEIVVGDNHNPEKIRFDIGGMIKQQNYPIWTFVSGGGFDNLHFRSAGSLDLQAIDNLTSQILIATSDKSGVIAANDLRYMPKEKVISLYSDDQKSHNLAVLLEGEFRSGYLQSIIDDDKKIPPFIPFSKGEAKMALIADSDFLSDDLWVSETSAKNPLYGTISYAPNAKFLLNLIDNMLGGREKIKYEQVVKPSQSNIINVIYDKYYQKYGNELESLSVLESKIWGNIEKIKQQVALSEFGQNLQYREELSEQEKKYEEYQQQIRQLNHQINNAADNQINIFVMMNLIVYPFLAIILLFVIVFIWRRINLIKVDKIK